MNVYVITKKSSSWRTSEDNESCEVVGVVSSIDLANEFIDKQKPDPYETYTWEWFQVDWCVQA